MSTKSDRGRFEASTGTSSEGATHAPPDGFVNTSNLHGLDYGALAAELGPPPTPIIDVHSHIMGSQAVDVFREVADLFGIDRVYSMTPWELVPAARERMPDRLRFIAVPDFRAEDRRHAHGDGFLERIEQFHSIGARVVKFWTAPRATDLAEEAGVPGMMRLDSPQRLEQMRLASSLGMHFMAHIADPDTWFATKYADATRYGTKADQYVPVERLLDRFTQPWILAHMGGWPEDLDFLDGLLDRHDNLHLDTSACKWVVRALGRHATPRVREFFTRWRGRLLFGSDIVTVDAHLDASAADNEMAAKAAGRRDAFDLYASRYYALRTMFEGEDDRPSPIADPDLALVDPETFGPYDSPTLRGHRLPTDVLRTLYRDAASTLFDPVETLATGG